MNVYGYKELQVNRSQPTFSLSQNNGTVSISNKTGLSDYAYFQADSNPGTSGANSCSKDNTSSSNWTTDSDGSIASIADNKWICFRAKKTSTGVYGYAKLQVDLSEPSFTLTQDGDTVKITSKTGLSDYAYFETSNTSDPGTTGATSCSKDNTAASNWTTDADGSITVANTGRWICFRAKKTSTGVYGYAKLQVDLSQPIFSLSQNNGTVSISNKTGLSDYAYFQADSNPGTSGANSCSKDNTSSSNWTTDSDGSIASIADNKWICFRAKKTSTGVNGYSKLEVDLSQPSFSLSQNNTIVAIADKTGLSDYAYFETSNTSDPGTTGATSCSKDNTAAANWTTDADGSITVANNGRWICFRAKKTSTGVYGYAKLQVDLSQSQFHPNPR